MLMSIMGKRKKSLDLDIELTEEDIEVSLFIFSSYKGSKTGSGITFNSLSFTICDRLIKIVKSLGGF